jgi:hypothetical protein
VHRDTVRLIARTATLVANKRSLKRYGLLQGLAPFTVSSTFFSVTPNIALDAYTHGVSQLEIDLGRWTLNELVGDQRTRIGSLSYWHMCRILLRKYIQDRPLDDVECQSSAKAILELCAEAGDKIEFLNWVSAPAIELAKWYVEVHITDGSRYSSPAVSCETGRCETRVGRS